MNRRSIFGRLVGLPLLLAIAATQISPHASGQTSRKSNTPLPVTIPFELVNRHVTLQVKVNNSRSLSFVLDTGAQFAIINLGLAKELGLKLEGQVRMGGAGSQISMGAFVRGATFTIPGFEGFSQPVTLALPIGNLAPRAGRDFDGIIGSEFIKQYVVELDYQARQLKIHDKDKFVYTGPGESIPIQLVRGHPIIEAWVTPVGSDPIKGRFVVDIGSSGALALYSPFVVEHQLLGPNMTTIKALGAGAGGEISGRVGRVSEFRIGKYSMKNLLTMFSQDTKGAFASKDLEGNIGAMITSLFKLYMDYTKNRIIFEPNATYAHPPDRASSGLSVQAEGKDYRTFRIMVVLENSPAFEAGLLQNDIITAIDGTPASALTLSKLNETLERPGTYKLTVRRGEKTLQVTLTPRKLV